MPRLCFGLEVHNIMKKDIHQVEAFQKRCLKQLQDLPTRSSGTASLALVGMLPVNVCVERKMHYPCSVASL